MELLCRIEMFGRLRVVLADQELTRFRTHKIGWMLAYLALHLGQSVSRERLLDLFWPEMGLEAGRGNLNNALSSLRRQLDTRNGVLIADRVSVRLDPQAVGTDVREFESLLQTASRTPPGPQQIGVLERAAGTYRGELLPGCYEGWAVEEQQRLHGLYVDLLGRWSEALEQAGRLADSLAVVARAVQADGYREGFALRQMRLQAALGQPAAALETFRALERRFEDELGTAPSPDARELVRRLREDPGSFTRMRDRHPEEPAAAPPESSAPRAGDGPPRPPAQPETTGPVASPVSPMPLVLTRYFGRAEELGRLTDLLAGGEARLVTLLGPGGSGKTRLALEAARHLSPTFDGRVWWVSLADLPDARLLSTSLSRTLQVAAAGAGDPLEPVLARLNAGPSLLVLDNLEQLLRDEASDSAKGDLPLLDTATAVVRLLLERAPLLRCLVTSRRALRLSGEQEFPLDPLPLPAPSATLEDVLTSPSVALYADRARLARPDFTVNAHNAAAVAGLCRKLEGMPLAIEMAAAWAKVLPPARMLERLEERLDALTALSGRRRDLPARHQSLRAVIDWSYDLLDAPQRRLLASLSVFRGGCTLEAAEAVCGEPGAGGRDDVLELLTSLVDKSLVVCEEAAGPEGEVRYRLLESVRQYAHDRLDEGRVAAEVRARHFSYFRAMAEKSWEFVRGPEQVACLNELEREHDNQRAALDWVGTEEGRGVVGPEAELDLAGWLRPFWDMRSYWREGRKRLGEALARSGSGAEPTAARGRALLGAGLLAANMGDRAAAKPHYEECLHIRKRLGDTRGVGSVAIALGNIARDEGDFPAAHRWYAESMEAVKAVDDSFTLMILLGHLGALAERENDTAARRRYNEEALALSRRAGDLLRVALHQANLVNDYIEAGDLPAGYAAIEESLTILLRVGDQRFTALSLEQFASLELVGGRIASGTRFTAAAQRIREEIGSPLKPNMQRNMRQAKQDLGEAAFAAAFAEGHALGREEAIREALDAVHEPAKFR